jgi:hypothetical protein
MKTKFLILIFLLALLESCNRDIPQTPSEEGYITDDITTLVVPEGHDLRPIILENTNINLSEESRADFVKVKIYKIENSVNILVYSGSLDRNKSISNLVKIPNHVKLLSVQADLAVGTKEWIVTPSELENLVIEDDVAFDVDADEAKSSTASKSSATAGAQDTPPTWNCNDYAEFEGKDDGDFKISNASTQGLNVDKGTKIYICSGGSWAPSYLNDNGNKLTIYVGEGATLTLQGNLNSTIYNVGTFNGSNFNISDKSEFDSWGTANISGNLNLSSNDVNIYGGTTNVSGSLNVNDNGHIDVDEGKLNVGGSATISGTFHNKQNSEINISGNLSVNSNGSFSNECSATISGNFINNKKVDFQNASYTVITGSFTNNSNGEVSVK